MRLFHFHTQWWEGKGKNFIIIQAWYQQLKNNDVFESRISNSTKTKLWIKTQGQGSGKKTGVQQSYLTNNKKNETKIKQAGAELCQAQGQFGLAWLRLL